MVDLGEYTAEMNASGKAAKRTRPRVDDPAPRTVYAPLLSVDDHLMGPPDTFVGPLQ